MDEFRIDGLDFSSGSDEAEENKKENGSIEFEFSVGMPKTAIEFQDGEDVPAQLTLAEEKPVEPEIVAAEPDIATDRSADDEQFVLPDDFLFSGEEGLPFADNGEPMIWTTYVPRFTEASEKRYNFIDEDEARRREEMKRAKMERSVNLSSTSSVSDEPSEHCPSAEKSEVVSPSLKSVSTDTTAEIDTLEALDDAVVVSVNGSPREAVDAISVFKFDDESVIKEETPVLSEEEIARKEISELMDRRQEEPETEPEDIPEHDFEVVLSDEPAVSEERREIPHPASAFKKVYSSPVEEELPENERPKGYERKLDVGAKGGSEFTYFTQRESFKDKFLDTLMSIRLRAIVACVLSALLFVFETAPLFIDGFYTSLGLLNPLAVGGVDALIMLGLVALSLPELVRAVDSLRRGCVCPELSMPLSLIAVAICALYSSSSGADPILLGSVYAVNVLSSIFASYNMVSANFTAFKTISEKGEKRVIDVRHTRYLERENMALDGAIDESKSDIARDFKTSFVSDFMKNSVKKQENHKGNILILALVYGIAFVLGIVMFFIADGAISAIVSAAVVICLATPAFTMLSHKLPYNHAQSELSRVCAAVVGEDAFYEADGVNVVAFEDTDIFGEDDVSFKSVSLSNKDGDFRRAMKMMSQLFAALGGPLSKVFSESLGKTFAPAQRVVIEEDGAEGIIDGVQVMAGSAEYMARKGIVVPAESGFVPASLKIMYAAEGGALFAKFSIQYSFSEDFAHMLSAMRERNITPLVYSRDPNINNELLRFLTGAKDCIRVMKKSTVVPASEKIYPALSARLAVHGEKIDAVNLLLVANKYSKLQSGIALTELAASLVGAILACLIVICDMTGALSSALIAIWQIAWCVALHFMSRSSFKTSKKRKK